MKFGWLLSLLMLQSATFRQQQQKHERVKTAYREKQDVVASYFRQKHLRMPGFHLFIRAFKVQQTVEVWVKEKNSDTYALLHTYAMCATSGTLGPKRREGDLQTPEGAYHIRHFNPVSTFYLSLGINYPNASDQILGDRRHPGSDIYLHGNCVTVGCIPLTDDKIKELYLLAVEARSNGQEKIPVYIFPSTLTDAGLAAIVQTHPQHSAFWKNMQPLYVDFERTRKIKTPAVNTAGAYTW